MTGVAHAHAGSFDFVNQFANELIYFTQDDNLIDLIATA